MLGGTSFTGTPALDCPVAVVAVSVELDDVELVVPEVVVVELDSLL